MSHPRFLQSQDLVLYQTEQPWHTDNKLCIRLLNKLNAVTL